MAKVSDLWVELKALRALQELTLLAADAAAGFVTSYANAQVTATGTSGAGKEVYRNSSERPVAVVVRDRGGTGQQLFVGKQPSLVGAQGFTTSGTAGATTDGERVLVLPNESIYARASASAVTVDVLVFDPGAALRRLT